MKALLLAVSVLAGMAQASFARTVEQQLISSLRAQGYVVLEQGYTFLGRLRIVAENDRFHREIVVNPGTGEILRDYAVTLPQKSSPANTAPPTGVGGGAVATATVGGTQTVPTTDTPDDTGAVVGSVGTAGGIGSDPGVDVTDGDGTVDTSMPDVEIDDGGVFEMVLPESVLPLVPGQP